MRKRSLPETAFIVLALLSLGFALCTLLFLLAEILADALPKLSWDFLVHFPSRNPEQAGILSALVGSFWLIVLTAVFAVPLGVGAAVYMEKYAGQSRWNSLMEINIGTLAGVPSIIYGLLGLGLFVRMLMLGRSLLAGALTLSLLVLPIVIITAREAIRTVPQSLQDGALALGATRWQMIKTIVLPLAFPGILTGTILALSRAIGETAPLITIGALTYIAFLPDSVFSQFSALPIQIFNWVSRPQSGFHIAAAAGIVVLLAVTLFLNAAAILLRNSLTKRSPSNAS